MAAAEGDVSAASGNRWRRRLGTARSTVLVLAAWALLLLVVRMWGLHVAATSDEDLKLRAVPLFGRWELVVGWRLLVPVAAGAVAVAVLPRLARRWSWPAVLAAAAGAGVVLSLALAVAEPHPQTWQDIHVNYGRHVGLVDEYGPARFIGDYAEIQRITELPVHLQSHPPGLLLLLWSAAQVGLVGPWFENALAMLGVAAAVTAVLAVVRDVADEPKARAAAPFLAVAPAAVWHTNADLVFSGVGLAAVAGVVLATSRRSRRAAVLLAAAGGLGFGAALMLSFGVALLAVPMLVIVVWRSGLVGRSWWAWPVWLVPAVAGTAAVLVVLLPWGLGYWWPDGLAATQDRYVEGVGGVRGYWYFLVANLAVLALALGPAIAVGLSRLRDRRVWLVVGSGLAVVLLADVSGLSSGETERIWQPFMPLLLVAGCALHQHRRWLVLQLATTVVLGAALRVPW